jgi:hypothetical protein
MGERTSYAEQAAMLNELIEELAGLEELDWTCVGDTWTIAGDSTFIEARNVRSVSNLELLVNGLPMSLDQKQRAHLCGIFRRFLSHECERSLETALEGIRLLKKRKEDF